MKRLITIVGPTAVGKTSLSLRLAKRYQTEIISGDSRQMFRHMDIGTAKPTQEEKAQAPHHFIDTLDPSDEYSAGQFERDAEALIDQLFETHDHVIVVGGSTLYMEALWFGFNEMPVIPPEVREDLMQEWEAEGLSPLLEELQRVDPQSYDRVDRNNPMRVIRALEMFRATGTPISQYRTGRIPKQKPYQIVKIGLFDEREVLYERINQRVLMMIEVGLEEECKTLLKMGYSPSLRALQSIGYAEMFAFLAGEIDKEEAIRLVQRNSRRYAKRQLTYYRRFEGVEWFQAGDWEAVERFIDNFSVE